MQVIATGGRGFGAIYVRSSGLQVRYALCILLMARAFNAHRDRIPMKKNIMAAALCTPVLHGIECEASMHNMPMLRVHTHHTHRTAWLVATKSDKIAAIAAAATRAANVQAPFFQAAAIR